MGDEIEVGKVYFAKSTGDGSPLEWQELGEATAFDFLASGATEFNVQYDVGKLLKETSGTISFKVPWWWPNYDFFRKLFPAHPLFLPRPYKIWMLKRNGKSHRGRHGR